jgi:hypothetical protein
MTRRAPVYYVVDDVVLRAGHVIGRDLEKWPAISAWPYLDGVGVAAQAIERHGLLIEA